MDIYNKNIFYYLSFVGFTQSYPHASIPSKPCEINEKESRKGFNPPDFQCCFSGPKRVIDWSKRVTNRCEAELGQNHSVYRPLCRRGRGGLKVWGKGSRKAEKVIMTEKIYSCLPLLSSCIKDKRRLNT